jgi:hypothetical protein
LVELFLVHTSILAHRYKLQPQKSVVIEVNKKGRNQQDKNLPLKINQDDMPTVEKSAHLGIPRSKSNQKTENSQVEACIDELCYILQLD